MIEHILHIGKSTKLRFNATAFRTLFECRIFGPNGEVKEIVTPEKIVEARRKENIFGYKSKKQVDKN